MMSRVSDAHGLTLSSVASDDRNDLEIIISDERAEDQIKFSPSNWHPNTIKYETPVEYHCRRGMVRICDGREVKTRARMERATSCRVAVMQRSSLFSLVVYMPLAVEILLAHESKSVSSNHVVVTSIRAASEGVSSMFRRCEEQLPGRSRSSFPADLGMFLVSCKSARALP